MQFDEAEFRGLPREIREKILVLLPITILQLLLSLSKFIRETLNQDRFWCEKLSREGFVLPEGFSQWCSDYQPKGMSKVYFYHSFFLENGILTRSYYSGFNSLLVQIDELLKISNRVPGYYSEEKDLLVLKQLTPSTEEQMEKRKRVELIRDNLDFQATIWQEREKREKSLGVRFIGIELPLYRHHFNVKWSDLISSPISEHRETVEECKLIFYPNFRGLGRDEHKEIYLKRMGILEKILIEGDSLYWEPDIQGKYYGHFFVHFELGEMKLIPIVSIRENPSSLHYQEENKFLLPAELYPLLVQIKPKIIHDLRTYFHIKYDKYNNFYFVGFVRNKENKRFAYFLTYKDERGNFEEIKMTSDWTVKARRKAILVR